MQAADHLKSKISRLPQKPGCYRFYDGDGKILYVGKAKKLRNRVGSYFNSDRGQNGKTRLLVRKITDIQFIVTESEYDALLLENSLIKKHQPRFNIQLRDDKTYPYIVIRNERFPRIYPTRRRYNDGSEYFGPYASVKAMKAVLDVISKTYKLRTCKYNLSEGNIEAGKFRVCLEYHIGNCLGPCEGKQAEEDYLNNIQEIRRIIRGNVNTVIRDVKERLHMLAENLEFEKAALLKSKLDLLEKHQTKSTVVSPTINNVDVVTMVADDKFSYVNYMRVMNGGIVQSNTVEIKSGIEEEREDIITTVLAEMRERYQSDAKEVLSAVELGDFGEQFSIHIPQRGDKKKLLEFSERNAKYYMLDRHKAQDAVDPDRKVNRILTQLQKDLRMPELPKHIECFDNSNLQGTNPVAACVVFKNAKPSKKDYRKFNIKTVEGPDDFASMEEVVGRRYRRLLAEGEPLPQLIVIDGGKGQLSSAIAALERLDLRGKITIVGIAKRLEEIYFPDDPIPLYIDKKSESLKLLQQCRNEAHRFGITFHRQKRSKGALQSELKSIKGIGSKTTEELLRAFGSVKKIRLADDSQLANFVNKRQLVAIKEWQKESAE